MDYTEIWPLSSLEKMIVRTDSNDWHGMSSERIWVKAVGKDEFQVENNVLYAYGLSFGDIVRGARKDGALEFVSVSQKGGHSNYRVLLRKGVSPEEFRKRFPELERLGCRYESSRNPEDVFSVDVPPNADVQLIYNMLEAGVDDGLWHLDEGNFEH